MYIIIIIIIKSMKIKLKLIYILEKKKKNPGGAGYRSQCPMHAKHLLYHVSYTPIMKYYTIYLFYFVL